MRPEVLEAYVSSFIASSPGPVVHFGWHGGEPTLAGIEFYRAGRRAPATGTCRQGGAASTTCRRTGPCSTSAGAAFWPRTTSRSGISIDGPAAPARRLPPGPARAADARPGDAGLRPAAGGRHRPRRALHLNAANGRAADRGLPVLRRQERAVGAVPPRRGAARGWRRLGAFGHARRRWASSSARVFDEWVRHDIERIGVQNFLECFLVGKRQAGQHLRHVADLRTGARHGARRQRLFLRPLRRSRASPRRGEPRRAGRARRARPNRSPSARRSATLAGVLSRVPGRPVLQRRLSEGPLCDLARRRGRPQLPLRRIPALLQPCAALSGAHGGTRPPGTADLGASARSSSSPSTRSAPGGARPGATTPARAGAGASTSSAAFSTRRR